MDSYILAQYIGVHGPMYATPRVHQKTVVQNNDFVLLLFTFLHYLFSYLLIQVKNRVYR